jgi:hypothetical protein
MIKDKLAHEYNKMLCEALDCQAQATRMIGVKVGNKGSIYLYLCDGCQSKFNGSKLDE